LDKIAPRNVIFYCYSKKILNDVLYGVVSMNKPVIFSIALMAIVAIAITPLASAVFTGLDETEVEIEDGAYKKIKFESDDDIINTPDIFGGYAIFTTDGDVIAATSHAGFYDSEVQGDGGNLDAPIIDFPGPAALCSSTTGCGGEWHVHLVKPAGNALCQIAAVGELTYEEPSENTELLSHKKKAFVKGIQINNIPIGTDSYTEALSGANTDFTVGATAVDPNPVSGELGVAFPLVPVFSNPSDPSTLLAVCIGPAT
jgi:hypothetical protein